MEVLNELKVSELTHFVREHHSGLVQLPTVSLRAMLTKYMNTTLIFRVNDQLVYFAIYQEWPDFLNFFAIGGKWSYSRIMWHILHHKFMLPNKPFGFFDEQRMEGRFVCQSSHH